jgi:hypothetical protein
MRASAKAHWESLRAGKLKWLVNPQDQPAAQWPKAVKSGSYFGYGTSSQHDALVLFALEENSYAENELDFAIKCLGKAEEVDDCYSYGEMRDFVYDEYIEELEQTYTTYTYQKAAEKGVEPWHDKDLGRALRARELFTCRWLKTGQRDDALLRLAAERLRKWLDFQYGLPEDDPERQRISDRPDKYVKHYLLWQNELGEYELAKQFCRNYADSPLRYTPKTIKFVKTAERLLYFLAVYLSSEWDVSDFFPEALDRYYWRLCRKIGRGEEEFFLSEYALGIAHLRAQVQGLNTEPQELLRKIRLDS